MPIIELDMLIAFVNASDSLHRLADNLFKKITRGELREVKVASSALLEYELVLRSRGHEEREIREDIRAFNMMPNLGEEPLTAEVILKASEIREKHSLPYFDSLHCATAILFDGEIISIDCAYDDVPEVSRLDPRLL